MACSSSLLPLYHAIRGRPPWILKRTINKFVLFSDLPTRKYVPSKKRNTKLCTAELFLGYGLLLLLLLLLKLSRQPISFKKVSAILVMLEFLSTAEGLVNFVLRSPHVQGHARYICRVKEMRMNACPTCVGAYLVGLKRCSSSINTF